MSFKPCLISVPLRKLGPDTNCGLPTRRKLLILSSPKRDCHLLSSSS